MMSALAGALLLAALVMCKVAAEIVKQIVAREYESWAPALARAVVRLAGLLHPPRAREWRADLAYVQNFEQSETGLWEALCHLVAAPKLSSLAVVGWIASSIRQSILGSTYPPASETSIPIGLTELEQRKRLLLVGPPGVGKTYTAVALAKRVIRSHALALEGRDGHSQPHPPTEQLVNDHIRFLQLHASYSHEDFIGRLRRQKDGAVFEDGDLPRLLDEISRKRASKSDSRLPWVLILDELDRVDVSRVFGGALYALDCREKPVHLAVDPQHQPSPTIALPPELYLIGTLAARACDQVDDAIYRRFPVKRLGFDRARLIEALHEDWQKTNIATHHPWNRIYGEIELLVARAERLNEELAELIPPKQTCELGHAFFSRIVPFLAHWDLLDHGPHASRLLWNESGHALLPVHEFWRTSLEPFIYSSLRDIEADARATLSRIANVFLTGEV